MMVKQIDLHKALELAGKGREVLVLLPSGSNTDWKDYLPGTLQDMLEGCLFFRKEPAMENSGFADAVEAATKKPVAPETDTPPKKQDKSSTGDPGLENRPAVESGPKRTKMVDTGKIKALHKAGWSQNKIADEMGIAQSTVGKYIRQMMGDNKTV